MSLRFAFVCAFLFIIQPVPGACAQAPPAPPLAAAVPEIVLRETLPSGLRLIVAPRTGSKLVALDLRVRVGSASETPATSGLAHFIEHLTFKGSASRSPGAIDAAAESLGGELSARTSREATQYETVCPRENWHAVLGLIAETVLQPAFRPDDVERERRVIEREMATAEIEPMRQGFALLMGTAFAPTDPQSLPLMGSPANVRSFGPDDLRAFWETHYRPENMTLVVAGAVDPKEVVQAARELFPATASRTKTAETGTASAIAPGVVRAPAPRPQNGQELATVLMGFRVAAPDEKNGKVEDDPALAVLMPLLAGQPESRLNHTLLRQKGIYQVRADYQPATQGASLILIAVTGTSANADAMEFAVVAELERLRVEPVTDEEVENARRTAQGQRKNETKTVEGWARQLAQDDLLARSNYDQKLAAVTPEAVRVALARHLTAYRYTIAVVGAVGAAQ